MKRRKVIPVLMAVTLVVLSVVSCTATPRYKVTVSGVSPGPDIGVTVDEEFRVVDIARNSAAEKAGVQVGDILLDLTWIPSDAPAYMPESSDVIYVDRDGFVVDAAGNRLLDADGQPITIQDAMQVEPPFDTLPGPPPEAPVQESPTELVPELTAEPPTPIPGPSPVRDAGPPVADYIEKDTVPFTDGDRIRSLKSYGVPLKLRIQRGEQEMELTIIPRPILWTPDPSGVVEPTITPVLPPYDYF